MLQFSLCFSVYSTGPFFPDIFQTLLHWPSSQRRLSEQASQGRAQPRKGLLRRNGSRLEGGQWVVPYRPFPPQLNEWVVTGPGVCYQPRWERSWRATEPPDPAAASTRLCLHAKGGKQQQQRWWCWQSPATGAPLQPPDQRRLLFPAQARLITPCDPGGQAGLVTLCVALGARGEEPPSFVCADQWLTFTSSSGGTACMFNSEQTAVVRREGGWVGWVEACRRLSLCLDTRLEEPH